MSEPESWKQEGPLDLETWSVEMSPSVTSAMVVVSGEGLAFVHRHCAQHLRDFARALDRAAAMLERGAVE